MFSRQWSFWAILISAFLTAFCYSPVGAEAGKAPNSSAATAKSRHKELNGPVIYGFRLGMTQDQLLTRFRDFPEVSTLAKGGSAVVNLTDREKRPAVRGVRNQSGVIELEIYPPYLTSRFGGSQERIKEGNLYLLVKDRKLTLIRLVDAQSDAWTNLDQFIKEMAARYGIKGSTRNPSHSVKTSPPEGLPPDFATKTVETISQGYSTTYSCLGPPAPAGICDLWIKQSSPAR